MKKYLKRAQSHCLLMVTLVVAATLAVGCTKETDVGGQGASGSGPGVADRENSSENTFQLTMPSGEIDITQGQSESVTIGIERGSVFKQDVTVKMKAPIEAVTVNPETATFSGDKSEIEFELVAAADAPVKTTSVTVIGKPGSGESVNGRFTVQVNDDE